MTTFLLIRITVSKSLIDALMRGPNKRAIVDRRLSRLPLLEEFELGLTQSAVSPEAARPADQFADLAPRNSLAPDTITKLLVHTYL